MLGGVAGGTAQFFDVDVLYVRIGLVALTVFGGGGAVLYIAALALIPEEGSDVSLAQKILRRARGYAWRSWMLNRFAAPKSRSVVQVMWER